MALAMTKQEREEFLAEVHVGVLAVGDPGGAPLAVPVWYSYAPGGAVTVITGRDSLKARLIRDAGRFALCAQTEVAPYKYVSVEGDVTEITEPVPAEERRAMAHRYLGAEFGDLYLAATEADAGENVAIRMFPDRWRTIDYAKQFA
jgi:nitroimidazol reductase NimA-like FMN-containing flavoprotein (pyridoxamine 5'-phosphate oxidase superfamily)